MFDGYMVAKSASKRYVYGLVFRLTNRSFILITAAFQRKPHSGQPMTFVPGNFSIKSVPNNIDGVW